MPIEVSCPCGKRLRLRDELAGMRVKCPVCGDAVDVPEESEANPLAVSAASPEPAAPRFDLFAATQPVRAEVTGKPLKRLRNDRIRILPAGHAKLSLTDSRLILETEHPLFQQRVEVLLCEIEAAEIRVFRQPRRFWRGLFTTVILVGFYTLYRYFTVKDVALVFLSQSISIGLATEGDPTIYQHFMTQALNEAEAHRSEPGT